jgi:hypothetical protein
MSVYIREQIVGSQPVAIYVGDRVEIHNGVA